MSQISTAYSRPSLPPLPLPEGISENYVHCSTNGLTYHFLEAGHALQRDRPLIVLVHGYPELAFSWRKIMPSLAKAGHYVVAFDQRGYGRTTGWDNSNYANTNMAEFTLTNLVRDVVILVHALGYREVKCIVGHDFGAVTASTCALTRPDLFKSVVMMSHPFKSPAELPFNTAHGEAADAKAPVDIQRELSKLPEPRKHYKWYNSTHIAALHWSVPVQGMQAFLRGYLHVKSADWAQNDPKPLNAWSASELAKLPHYYIMPLLKSMPEVIASMMATEDETRTKKWMSDADLAVYVSEWSRTGFQGGLNWYRAVTNPKSVLNDMALFAGKKIECPATFISGSKDWGNYQEPGAIENLPKTCTQFKGVTYVEGAGHWPQQEQPKKVAEAILAFLNTL